MIIEAPACSDWSDNVLILKQTPSNMIILKPYFANIIVQENNKLKGNAAVLIYTWNEVFRRKIRS